MPTLQNNTEEQSVQQNSAQPSNSDGSWTAADWTRLVGGLTQIAGAATGKEKIMNAGAGVFQLGNMIEDTNNKRSGKKKGSKKGKKNHPFGDKDNPNPTTGGGANARGRKDKRGGRKGARK